MKLKIRIFVMSIACLVIALLSSCSKAPESQATESSQAANYHIVCTTGMVADIVRQVVGELATVENLMGEGVDPHLYKPTRGDLLKLAKADVIFYSGLLLEGRMIETFERAKKSGKPIFAVTSSLDHNTLLIPEGSRGHPDPHVWMDVSAWSKAVDVVTDSLSIFDNANAQTFDANAKVYKTKLLKLHQYAVTAASTIPQQQRTLITAHDAFNYFGRAYGLNVLGIQGLSTESEAGLDDINKLVDFIVSNKIKAVFIETSVSDKNIRALIEGAKVRHHDVIIGGKLFSDAMGQSRTYEGTYIGMLDHNITTIVRALGGEAPPAGANGKLSTTNSHE